MLIWGLLGSFWLACTATLALAARRAWKVFAALAALANLGLVGLIGGLLAIAPPLADSGPDDRFGIALLVVLESTLLLATLAAGLIAACARRWQRDGSRRPAAES